MCVAEQRVVLCTAPGLPYSYQADMMEASRLVCPLSSEPGLLHFASSASDSAVLDRESLAVCPTA